MAYNTSSDVNQSFELVVPVKILVKPGFSGTETTTSLRRRSITSIPQNGSLSRCDQGAGPKESGNIFLVSDQVHTKSYGAGGSETIIRIENPGSCDNKSIGYYMRHSFRILYLSGMSTYDPEKKETGEETWMEHILRGFQKAIYWTMTSASMFFTCLSLKHVWMLFALQPEVPKLVYAGYWLFTIASEIYNIYLFAFCHKRINKMMLALRKFDSHSIEEVQIRKRKYKNPKKLISMLFIVSILACFMQPVGRFGIHQMSPKKVILDSSKTLSVKLFIWNQKDLDFDNNKTRIMTLYQEYGTSLTTSTFFMGLTEIGTRFCSNMKMDTALNLAIVAAVLTWIRNRYFGKKVKNIDFKKRTDEDYADDQGFPSDLFAEFEQLKEENRILNGLVGGMLKIIHAYNLMRCTTFLMRCLDKRGTMTELLFLIYSLIKVAVLFHFGRKAAAFNAVYEKWITSWSMHSTNCLLLARVPAILHEMKNEPLGLGRGSFLVGQGFIFRFLGFVGSVFMLEVDDDDDADE